MMSEGRHDNNRSRIDYTASNTGSSINNGSVHHEIDHMNKLFILPINLFRARRTMDKIVSRYILFSNYNL